MDSRSKVVVVLVLVSLVLVLCSLSLSESGLRISVTSSVSSSFVIEGLVENRLNLSYLELHSFPMISEVTTLQCVGSGNGTGGPLINYNWTGVPLFYLLQKAKVIPGTYRRVIFNATDGFSDSIMLDIAMNPTTILALKANGTDLEQVTGFGSGYRLVLPGRWGYKWVKWIKQIIIVDHDYKGNYERWGLPDEALRPNFTMPITTPTVHNFTANSIQILTNGSLQSFIFKSDKDLVIEINGEPGTDGYLYVAFPRGLLAYPYQVYVNRSRAAFSQVDTNSTVYIYVEYPNASSTIEIKGALQSSAGTGGGSRSRYMLQ